MGTGSKETILLEKRTKGPKGAKKPKAAIAKTGVSKNTKKATASITGALDKKYYRRDLQSKVTAKYARLRASMKTKKIEGHKSRAKKEAGARICATSGRVDSFAAPVVL